MSVHLKLEESPEGFKATLLQRDGDGKLIGHPSVRLVASAAEAKQQAETLARSLGLKVYGFTVALTQRIPSPVPKSRQKPLPTRDDSDGGSNAADGGSKAAKEERPPWLVPGVGKSL